MSVVESIPESVIPPEQAGLLRCYKRVVLNIMSDGTIHHKFGLVAGSGKPPMPVTIHEFNQLHRALRIGFRQQMMRFKRGGKPSYFKNDPQNLGESNEPSPQHD